VIHCAQPAELLVGELQVDAWPMVEMIVRSMKV